MSMQKIALRLLIASAHNARTIRSAESVAERAASLDAHGQLQPLTARQIKKGKEKGKYEVYIGETRRQAFLALVEAGKITLDHEVDVIVTNVTDDEAEEFSLAENVNRDNMHPADEFDRFKKLAENKKTPDQIAVRFGTTPTHVTKLLKLASVSPRLFDLFRKNEMNIEQLQAFTVNPDHTAQEAAWFDVMPFYRQPAHIKANLLGKVEKADHRLVKFVGLDTYEAAGGAVTRDLFDTNSSGYIADMQLLTELASAKEQVMTAEIAAEGWAEVEVRHGWFNENYLTMIDAEEVALTEAEQAEVTQIGEKIEAMFAEFDSVDEMPEEMQAEYKVIYDREEALMNRPVIYTAEQKAAAKAILHIDGQGDVHVYRGVELPKADSPATIADITAVEPAAASGKSGLGRPSHSTKLTARLTAHRTAALRIEMANNTHVALAATVHSLLTRKDKALRISSHEPNLDQGEDIPGSKAVQAFKTLQGTIKAEIPKDDADMLPWLVAQDTETLLRLLAYASALTVDVIDIGADQYSQHHFTPQRAAYADQLALALDLDMSNWWSPTAEGYFDHITKETTLAVITEAAGEQTAENVAGLKKSALAGRAETILADKAWLPAVLRRVDAVDVARAEIGEEEERDFESSPFHHPEEDGEGGEGPAEEIAEDVAEVVTQAAAE